MKKILLYLLILSGLSVSGVVTAQTFTVFSDTVRENVHGSSSLANDITNITANNLTPATSFGICDNFNCNSGTSVWNEGTSSGNTFTATYYANSTHDSTDAFHLAMSLTNAASLGSHWLTVTLTDNATLYSKDITFVLNKLPVSVPSVNSMDNEVLMYPNPASNELNVVYNANADIKKVAVYNIIGKLMTIYKVTGASANLNIESIPSGIYFVRLLNSHGETVVTKKFSKQ
jgi:hypothetical protein